MKSNSKHCASLSALALAIAALVTPTAQAADLPAAGGTSVIHCPRLIDTVAGKMLGPTSIVVEGQRIREVVAGSVTREGARVVDMPAGNTCMPGLIDAHTHLTSPVSKTAYSDKFRWNPSDYAILSTVAARRVLLAGFTVVRNLGDGNNETLALRNAINTGVVPGPRIFTAGKAIGTTGGHADSSNGMRSNLADDPGPNNGIVNSTEDVWKAVRQHYKEGADVLKIMASGGVLDESASSQNPQMTLDELKAVVAAAHDYGLTVAVHAHGTESIRRSVLAGVDSIEHGTFLDDQTIALMKQHGTWYVPTLTAGQVVIQRANEGGWFPPQVARKALEVGPEMMDTASRAYKAGVKIAFGTDYAHGTNAQEFRYLVQAGIPPMFAIQSATTHAATLLKHSQDYGSVSVGKFADVVAVPGNPLDDITLMERVDFVMKQGVVYKQQGNATAAALESSAAE